MALKIGEEQQVQMPMKTVASLIKWPRGEMGSLPADSEQFMMIEDIYKTVDKLIKNQEMNTSNKLRIEFMEKQVEKMLSDIEKLKDSNREMKYTNGNGH